MNHAKLKSWDSGRKIVSNMYAPEPILISAHKRYNIVKYLDKYYGLAQSLGELELTKESDRNTAGIIVADDLETLTGLIDKVVGADD